MFQRFAPVRAKKTLDTCISSKLSRAGCEPSRKKTVIMFVFACAVLVLFVTPSGSGSSGPWRGMQGSWLRQDKIGNHRCWMFLKCAQARAKNPRRTYSCFARAGTTSLKNERCCLLILLAAVVLVYCGLRLYYDALRRITAYDDVLHHMFSGCCNMYHVECTNWTAWCIIWVDT